MEFFPFLLISTEQQYVPCQHTHKVLFILSTNFNEIYNMTMHYLEARV